MVGYSEGSFVEADLREASFPECIYRGADFRGARLEGANFEAAKKAADALAERIGGESRVKFSSDPKAREFDVISDEYIAQAKPDLKSYGKSWRNQTKATFEAAKETGKKAYFQFEGVPTEDVLRKIDEYAKRYGVEYVIDVEPLGVHN